MRLLLVQTRRHTGFGLNGFIALEPLGLEVVAASLKNYEVRILDFFTDRDLEKALRDFRPNAVGIGCAFTTDAPRALSLASLVKSVSPETFTFVGGHHPSRVPGDFDSPAIDAVVIGDGEATTPDLLNAIDEKRDLQGLPGVMYRSPEGQVSNPERPLVMELDDLPIPARDLTRRYRMRYYLGTRRPTVIMETSRGCPYRCTFCSVWKFHRGTVRFMSPERVVEEIATLPPGDVFFTDDNFLTDPSRAARIADLIGRRGIKRQWIFQARSDSIVRHPQLIEQWASCGLSGVFIGFEKVDQDGLNSLDKRNRPENNTRALQILRRWGISVYASFIVDPEFTREDFDKLSQYVGRQKIEDPYFSILTPLPGTTLYDREKDRLTTRAHELFDLLHAVLPTKLPLGEFYRQFAGLYRNAYLGSRGKWNLARFLTRRLLTGKISVLHAMRLRKCARLLTDPEAYLLYHMSTATSGAFAAA